MAPKEIKRCKVGLGALFLHSLPYPIRCDLEEGHPNDHQSMQRCITTEDVTNTSIKIFNPAAIDNTILTWHNRSEGAYDDRTVGNLGAEVG